MTDRYKDVFMTEEYNHERFWEWGKWACRLHDGGDQISQLISDGLKPHHYLLDIGCGWLRGGIYFIEYLDIGHYYGFDKDQIQLDRGEILLKGKDLIHKKPKIELIYSSREIGNFIGRRMGKEGFDYMMAYSVFTHIDPHMVDRLFARVFPFLKSTGKFFATFYRHKHDSVKIGKRHPQRGEEYRSVIYPFSFFEDLAAKYNMFVEHLPLPKDIHSQYWMCFYKE